VSFRKWQNDSENTTAKAPFAAVGAIFGAAKSAGEAVKAAAWPRVSSGMGCFSGAPRINRCDVLASTAIGARLARADLSIKFI
jgi:hypothetical protein